ncbi:MAG: hypothetical protein HYT67_00235 [Candidatus Yanofskybacteria bacterium]|nr:hypothetical protein [Candidatus Yanofskybacteria bacterium]
MRVDAQGRVRVKVGDRVRIVTANGCMAHTRDNPREGTVVKKFSQKLYGGGNELYEYFQIRLDSGELVEKPAKCRSLFYPCSNFMLHLKNN